MSLLSALASASPGDVWAIRPTRMRRDDTCGPRGQGYFGPATLLAPNSCRWCDEWEGRGVAGRGTSRVPLPSNPEELRRRLNIMRNVYLMLKKFPGRADLQDLSPELFERYKEYLLGDYVHNLQARDSSDNVVHTPPWQLVLAYDRKQAFHYMVLDSMSIAAAWEKAWTDPVTKERHFSTPLSLYTCIPNASRLI